MLGTVLTGISIAPFHPTVAEWPYLLFAKKDAGSKLLFTHATYLLRTFEVEWAARFPVRWKETPTKMLGGLCSLHVVKFFPDLGAAGAQTAILSTDGEFFSVLKIGAVAAPVRSDRLLGVRRDEC